jgi:putative endonuclease
LPVYWLSFRTPSVFEWGRELVLPLPLPVLWFVISQRSGGICFSHRSLLPYPSNMPQREYHFYVYILASRSRSLYVGFTNDIRLRIKQHREKRLGSHTAKYNIGRLVYYEHFTYVLNAIAREKELKDWNRLKKIAFVEQENPTWEDLAAEW